MYYLTSNESIIGMYYDVRTPIAQGPTGWDARPPPPPPPPLHSSTSNIGIRPYCPELQWQPAAVWTHFSPKNVTDL